MAKKTSRPGRTLLIFFIAIGVLYGLAALGDSWKPKLGLDLEGGTRITLSADTAAGNVTNRQLREAKDIIDSRVNGSGVAEADVSVQGNRNIVVEIPGKDATDLVDVVKQTAQLRFRIVAMVSNGLPVTPTPSPSSSSAPSATPGAAPSKNPSPSAGVSPSSSPTSSAVPRPAPRLADEAPTADTCEIAQPGATGTSPLPPTGADKRVDNAIAWAKAPGKGFENAAGKCQSYVDAFLTYTCPEQGQDTAPVDDNSDEPLITCDEEGTKFLLSYAVVEGTSLKSASAGVPQNQATWVVNLELKGKDGQARPIADFAKVSRDLFESTGQFTAYPANLTKGQFAIALDGKVISNAGFNGIINNGQAEISGGFTQDSATTLANSLKYGALPVKFEDRPAVEQIGPSLAGDQLSAGVLAGIAGLIVVMLYCLLYYRGLGLVVIASLIVAAGVTYGLVLVLAQAAGFTLTLPGIAGLIVAVGITADSFIVFFERIRDEMRDGRSMRVAVEAGWIRARNTCLAADTVSLLAGVVLYIFAIGVVRGFAFALVVSTIIDIAVFFWFTKPVVTLLAKRQFFNSGHRLSGLSPETLGIDDRPEYATAGSVGGKA